MVHCAYPQPMAAFLQACTEREIPYVVTLTDFNIFCHYATMVDRQDILAPAVNRDGDAQRYAKRIRFRTFPSVIDMHVNFCKRLLLFPYPPNLWRPWFIRNFRRLCHM